MLSKYLCIDWLYSAPKRSQLLPYRPLGRSTFVSSGASAQPRAPPRSAVVVFTLMSGGLFDEP